MQFINWLTDNSGIITTVFFFTLFVGIGIWAFLPSNKASMQEQAKIPFKE